MNKYFLIMLIGLHSLVLFVLQGCISSIQNTQEHPSITATLPLTPSLTLPPQPTTELSPGYTPLPTLIPTNEKKMIEMLQSEKCKLPCYLGITPGKTSMQEAVAILENLGGFFSGSLENRYSYSLNIGNPIIPTPFPNKYALVNVSISLTTINGTVQAVYVGLLTEKTNVSLELYRKYWSRYSTNHIFSELGKPDQLYVNIDDNKIRNSELIIDYEKLGVLIRVSGSSQESNFCTINEQQEIYVTMDLFDPSSGLTAKDFNPYLNTPPHWPLVKDALGITVEEFYKQALANPSICFEPKE